MILHALGTPSAGRGEAPQLKIYFNAQRERRGSAPQMPVTDMDDVSNGMLVAMTAAKGGYDIAKDTLTLMAGLLTGLVPRVNSTTIVDKYNNEMDIGKAIHDYVERVEGEVIDGDITFGDGKQNLRVLDVPNEYMGELTDRLISEDVLFVIAKPEDNAIQCGTTRLLMLDTDADKAEQIFDTVRDEDLEQYEVDPHDIGYLAAALGSEEDHAITTLKGVGAMEAADVAKELRREHVHYQMVLESGGTFEIRVAETEEEKLKEAFMAAKLDKAIEGLDKDNENPILLSNRMKAEAHLAADKIAKGRSPLAENAPLKKMVIFDATDPSHRLEIDEKGCREIAMDEQRRSISANNPAYRAELSAAVKSLLAPAMAEAQPFKEMYDEYNKQIKEYDARVRSMREELTREMCEVREVILKNYPEMERIIEKELAAELDLKQALDENRTEEVDVEGYKKLIEERNITLGERKNGLEMYDKMQQLSLIEEEEVDEFEAILNQVDQKGKPFYEHQKQTEKEIKKLKAPEIEEIADKYLENFESRILREARHKNLYKSMELYVDPETGQMEIRAKEDFENLAPIYRKEEIQSQIEEAVKSINSEIGSTTLDHDIATPVINEELDRGMEPNAPTPEQVAVLESEAVQADHEIEMPNEEFE